MGCEPAQNCLPTFKVQFGDLNAGVMQAAILGGARAGDPVVDIDRATAPVRHSSRVAAAGGKRGGGVPGGWPVTLRGASATLRVLPDGAEIRDLDADLLGGHLHGGGTLTTAANEGKPGYTLEGRFEKLNASALGQLLGANWSGKSFDAEGKIDLSGFTEKDLASSAKGTLHFDWKRGAVKSVGGAAAIPAALARFDRWTADADVANGAITLKDNQTQQRSHKSGVEGSLTFGTPAKISFAAPKEPQGKH